MKIIKVKVNNLKRVYCILRMQMFITCMNARNVTLIVTRLCILDYSCGVRPTKPFTSVANEQQQKSISGAFLAFLVL